MIFDVSLTDPAISLRYSLQVDSRPALPDLFYRQSAVAIDPYVWSEGACQQSALHSSDDRVHTLAATSEYLTLLQFDLSATAVERQVASNAVSGMPAFQKPLLQQNNSGQLVLYWMAGAQVRQAIWTGSATAWQTGTVNVVPNLSLPATDIVSAGICTFDNGIAVAVLSSSGLYLHSPNRDPLLLSPADDTRLPRWAATCVSIVTTSDASTWLVFYPHTAAIPACRPWNPNQALWGQPRPLYAGLDDFSFAQAIVTDMVYDPTQAMYWGLVDLRLPSSRSENAHAVSLDASAHVTCLVSSREPERLGLDLVSIISGTCQQGSLLLNRVHDSFMVASRYQLAVSGPSAFVSEDLAWTPHLDTDQVSITWQEDSQSCQVSVGVREAGDPEWSVNAGDSLRLRIFEDETPHSYIEWHGTVRDVGEESVVAGDIVSIQVTGAIDTMARHDNITDLYLDSGQFRLHVFDHVSLEPIHGTVRVFTPDQNTYHNIEVDSLYFNQLIMDTTNDERLCMALQAEPIHHEDFSVSVCMDNLSVNGAWSVTGLVFGWTTVGAYYELRRESSTELALWYIAENGRATRHMVWNLPGQSINALRLVMQNRRLYIQAAIWDADTGVRGLASWRNLVDTYDVDTWLVPESHRVGVVSHQARTNRTDPPLLQPRVQWLMAIGEPWQQYTVGRVVERIAAMTGMQLALPGSRWHQGTTVLLNDVPVLDLTLQTTTSSSSNLVCRVEDYLTDTLVVEVRRDGYAIVGADTVRLPWTLTGTQHLQILMWLSADGEQQMLTVRNQYQHLFTTPLFREFDSTLSIRVTTSDPSSRIRAVGLTYPAHHYVWPYGQSGLDTIRQLLLPLGWQILEEPGGQWGYCSPLHFPDGAAGTYIDIDNESFVSQVHVDKGSQGLRQRIVNLEGLDYRGQRQHAFNVPNLVRVTGAEVWGQVVGPSQTPPRLHELDSPYLLDEESCTEVAYNVLQWDRSLRRTATIQYLPRLLPDHLLLPNQRVWWNGEMWLVRISGLQLLTPENRDNAISAELALRHLPEV